MVRGGEFMVRGGELTVRGGEFTVRGGEFTVRGGEFTAVRLIAHLGRLALLRPQPRLQLVPLGQERLCPALRCRQRRLPCLPQLRRKLGVELLHVGLAGPRLQKLRARLVPLRQHLK
eukprot:1176564-Prorocentrum_minimum.AAC.2